MMCIGMFMAILDVQVVATSLPTIQTALHISPDQMSWVQTVYLIAEVISIPLTGFLTRVLSMRWLFVGGVLVFTFASVMCASSAGFASLVGWRILQGFAAGTMIPAVFSAVFLLFPARLEAIATTVAGVLAMLAPTIGPIVGGWITQTYSWHWLFLINVIPGLISGLSAIFLLPRSQFDLNEAKTIDLAGLCLLALSLAALVIGLKEAPGRGWTSPIVLALLALSMLTAVAFAVRMLRRQHPIVQLKTLADQRFAVACLFNFVLGVGLFASVYMMPVFLALVRGHNALEIGRIMLVTGVAQLIAAPIAVVLEKRLDPRLLTGAGFLLFAIGLAMSANQTPLTDYSEMFWPQVVRSAALMMCLLPPTRLALGHLPPERVPDASGLFNLMRNLGGAIGIALVDTVIFGRAPVHAAAIADQLRAGDVEAAKAVGIPIPAFLAGHATPATPATEAIVRPLVEKLALTQALNEAWLVVAVIEATALFSLLLIRPVHARNHEAGILP